MTSKKQIDVIINGVKLSLHSLEQLMKTEELFGIIHTKEEYKVFKKFFPQHDENTDVCDTTGDDSFYPDNRAMEGQTA